jgi:type IV pilus assembly protein PilA
MKVRNLSNVSGFTLVELMVVVAIIGVLTSVAIPNFRRYQAKSKTSEAKIQLAGIYSAQTTMQSDYDHFATCLLKAGFTAPVNNYYAVGHAATNNTANALVRGEGGDCPDGATFRWAAAKNVGGVRAFVGTFSAQVASATVNNTGETFTAGALGYIDSNNNTAATGSIWTMDNNKNLVQVRIGY